jgi:hypothetical protein
MKVTLAASEPVVIVESHWRGPEFASFVAAELPHYDFRPIDTDLELTAIGHFHVLGVAKSRANREHQSGSA